MTHADPVSSDHGSMDDLDLPDDLAGMFRDVDAMLDNALEDSPPNTPSSRSNFWTLDDDLLNNVLSSPAASATRTVDTVDVSIPPVKKNTLISGPPAISKLVVSSPDRFFSNSVPTSQQQQQQQQQKQKRTVQQPNQASVRGQQQQQQQQKRTVRPVPTFAQQQHQKQTVQQQRKRVEQRRTQALMAHTNRATNTSKSSADRSRDTRLPSSRSSASVFDRLYKTHTAASRSLVRKVTATTATSPPFQTSVSSKTTPTKKRVVGVKLDDELLVFSRLHISGTVANTSKRYTQRHPSGRKHSSPAVRAGARAGTGADAGGGSATSHHSPTRTQTGSLVFSPQMKPKTKLLIRSKYHSGAELEELAPISFGYSFFQAFCEYEAGHLEAKELAVEIIQAFFKKDFPAGR
jgi:hypothetical protein